ncbi:MAG TPA: FAD-dependent oxidoreductase [Gemmatimonadales bacterium]|nr:FAD-dependent oxidoreductase [Gemmatimonadales bacterium]
MRRDPRHAAAFAYDLVVVGGGIQGAMVALEAARRGRRPLLVERNDFGGATSWNSLRIVHGGLRYLQTADLPRFFESVAERRWLLRHFPDLVRPLPCLMPLPGNGVRRASVMRLALLANDLLGATRNRGVRADRRLPPGGILSPEAARARHPGVDPVDLEGGALWYDAVLPNAPRLVMEVLRWAARAGARVLNYLEVTGLITVRGRVAGVRGLDRETGEEFEFQAPVVVNCAGPWCRALAARLHRDVPALFRPSLAFNVLLDREPPFSLALALTARRRGARTYFAYPWRGRLLAGTYHAPWSGPVDDPSPDERLVRELLRELDDAAPFLDAESAPVLRVHAGFLPADADGTVRLATRALVLDHGRAGGPEGLYSVSGVKFTTARRVAERTLRRVWARQGWGRLARPIVPRPEPRAVPELDELERLRREAPGLLRSRLQSLVVEEAVVHLDDLLLRRSDWGLDPGRLPSVADAVADLLGWDDIRRAAERARLATAAAPLGAA